MLTVTSDQNLFENDQIHFAINVTPDIRYFRKGRHHRAARDPGKKRREHQHRARAVAELRFDHGPPACSLPPFLTDIQPLQLIPDAQQMQAADLARRAPSCSLRLPPRTSIRTWAASHRHRPDRLALTPPSVLASTRAEQGRLCGGRRRREPSSKPASSRSSALRAARGRATRKAATSMHRVGEEPTAARYAGLLERFGVPIFWVDEFETTRAARSLYFAGPPAARLAAADSARACSCRAARWTITPRSPSPVASSPGELAAQPPSLKAPREAC